MATIFHLDASARNNGSVTRELSAAVVSKLPSDKVIRRDLSSDVLPFITEDWIGANFTDEADRSEAQKTALAQSDALIEELEASDTLVLGVPIYNFGVPASFKAWVDMICRARKTFRYTETGPEGLLTGKNAIIVIASGGTSVDSEIDFATGYIRHVLGFIGITNVEVISADALMMNPTKLEETKEAISKL